MLPTMMRMMMMMAVMMMAVVMGMVVVMMRPCADKASHCFVVYILRFRLFVSMIYLH